MEPDGSSVIGYIILLLILIFFNAFFALSEMAIVTVNDNKVRRRAQDGDKKAMKLLMIIENPTNFLSTIQIGVTLSGFLASAVAADTFTEIIVNSLAGRVPISPSTIRIISLILITLLLSYITLIFGELVPKRIAMQHAEKISYAIAGVLSGLAVVLKPFVVFLSASTNGVLRLIGIDPKEQPEEVTEEEIRLMLDVGRESGHIHESDQDMIFNIFEFDDRYVEDIMTHRTEIIAVDINSTLDEVLKVAMDSGYSRIPVYEDDLDDIEGLIYVKDLLTYVAKDSNPNEFDIRDFLRSPLFVIETTTGKALLAQIQEAKIQMAIVVDEYGGTAGLVTMEDLLEFIVGNIQDEYDDEEEDIYEISDNFYVVDGLTPIEEVFKFFDLPPIENHDDFDTIGGYILSKIGQIPAENEKPSVIVDNILFTISEMDERRIAKLTAERFIGKNDDESIPDPEDAPSGIKEKFKEREPKEA